VNRVACQGARIGLLGQVRPNILTQLFATEISYCFKTAIEFPSMSNIDNVILKRTLY